MIHLFSVGPEKLPGLDFGSSCELQPFSLTGRAFSYFSFSLQGV